MEDRVPTTAGVSGGDGSLIRNKRKAEDEGSDDNVEISSLACGRRKRKRAKRRSRSRCKTRRSARRRRRSKSCRRNPNKGIRMPCCRGLSSRKRSKSRRTARRSKRRSRSRTSRTPLLGSRSLYTNVLQAIARDDVVLFSKTCCPHCKMVKDIFNKLKMNFTTIELDKNRDGEAILRVLGKMTGARTVPRVFIRGRCIGGGCDVKALYESGKLAILLETRCGKRRTRSRSRKPRHRRSKCASRRRRSRPRSRKSRCASRRRKSRRESRMRRRSRSRKAGKKCRCKKSARC